MKTVLIIAIIVFILILLLFLFKREKYIDSSRRIVCSMTTIPQRYKLLPKVLDSLQNQSVLPSIIYIHVAPKTLKGLEYNIQELRDIASRYPNVVVNVVEKDLGPITKVVPVISLIQDDDRVVLVDDDVVYKPDMIEKLVKFNKPAVGYAGRESNFNYVTGLLNTKPVEVEFLETFAGVMYDGKILKGLAEYNETLDDTCIFQDDIKIGKFLKIKNVKTIVIPTKNFCIPDADGTPELRDTNLKSGNGTCYKKLWNAYTSPKKLFQTYHTLENIPQYIHENNKKYAPNYEITILDDEMGLNFIKTYFEEDVIAKYKELTGPHKADLLRYCLLYIHGGVYMDIKTILTSELDTFLIFDDLTAHRMYSVKSILANNIYQGFIASTQHNPIFLKLIKKVVQTKVSDIKKDYDLLTKQMYKVVKEDKDVILFREKCTSGKDKYKLQCICQDENGKQLFIVRDPKYPY